MSNTSTIEASVPGSVPDPIDELKHDETLSVVPSEEINVPVEAQVNGNIEVQARDQDDNHVHSQNRILRPPQNQGLRSRDADCNNSQSQNNPQGNRASQSDDIVLQADEFGYTVP